MKTLFLKKQWMRMKESSYIDGFIHLLFPARCICCEEELTKDEANCCSICYSELHFTHYEKQVQSTRLDELFWGRIPVQYTFALMYYEKTNNTRHILHVLKYKNRSDVGHYFGALLGEKISKISHFDTIEALIPVPIHRKKRYSRGYNQSEVICEGIQIHWNIPIEKELLHRKTHKVSQTKLNRFQRWTNSENRYVVSEQLANYTHIALVDDVVTTGSTIEVIVKEILKVAPSIQISIVSLAVTK